MPAYVVIWAVAGAALSAGHWAMLRAFVGNLSPSMPARQALARQRRSYLVRYGTLLALLLVAVQVTASAAIAAALGYWVVRACMVLSGVPTADGRVEEGNVYG